MPFSYHPFWDDCPGFSLRTLTKIHIRVKSANMAVAETCADDAVPIAANLSSSISLGPGVERLGLTDHAALWQPLPCHLRPWADVASRFPNRQCAPAPRRRRMAAAHPRSHAPTRAARALARSSQDVA
jgi:hypothetical protein